MSQLFTIVIPYRNRGIDRLERCLQSLEAQTLREFDLILVDYGSDPACARAVEALVDRFAFARYVYADSRGYPWSTSRAVNIGFRQSTAPYTIKTDCDMLFPPHFLATAAEHVDPQRVLLCAPYFLPRHFTGWTNLEDHIGTLRLGDRRQTGGFQGIATDVLHHLRGYDEFYRYWGMADTDIRFRLEAAGLDIQWLNEHLYFFHQWHAPANIFRRGIMPDSFWNQIVLYNHHQRGVVVRNDDSWGHCVSTAERAVFHFVDPDAHRLIERDTLHRFDRRPYDRQAVPSLATSFRNLPAGDAMAVYHAAYPAHTRWSDRVLRYGNRLLRRLDGERTGIAYRANVLHDFVVQFVACRELVADYYLGLEVQDGVSVLVRA